MSWIPIPTRQDRKAYRRLMRRDDGPACYGVFIALCCVAGKCPTRGLLADEDGPLSAEDLELQTGIPASAITKAQEVLSSKPIGWLVATTHQSAATTPLPANREANGRALDQAKHGGEDGPPAIQQHTTEHLTTGQDTTTARARDGVDVVVVGVNRPLLEIFEQAICRQASTGELNWVQQQEQKLTDAPLIVSGQQQVPYDVLRAAFVLLDASIQRPVAWLNAVLSNARTTGLMPHRENGSAFGGNQQVDPQAAAAHFKKLSGATK